MRKFALIAVIALAGCTRPESATRLLTEQGYKDVTITGYSFLSCSEDDTIRTRFEATSPTGARVTGTVCDGLFFKGATVRFD